jgi:hypothetical protein
VSVRRAAGTADPAGWRRRPRNVDHVGGLSPHPLTPSALLGRLERFGVRRAELPRHVQVAWMLGVAAVLALALLLDSGCSPFALDRAPALRRAAAFGFIVTALEIFSSWVAAAAEVTAAYVWIALQWLAATTASFLVSTGAMFARIWDGLKIVWSDVLKPALVWIDDHLKRLQSWLKDTFQPVFDFLKEVRCRLETFYKTFVRPVTDTIEFIRQVNRVLLVFHIDVLQKLDRVLQQIEQRIDEPFLWVETKLNEIANFVNSIVTVNGLFERIRLVKSLAGYAPSWIAGFWNSQINGPEVAARTASIPTDFPSDPPSLAGAELGAFYRGDDTVYDANIPELVALWRQASGLDPSTTASLQ